MQQVELIPHLFRSEFSRIVAVLCRHFGFHQVEIAEDIASDTFLTAMQSWGLGTIPPNPSAWLYRVAKNKAANYLKREQVFRFKIAPELSGSYDHENYRDIDLSTQNIDDSQLRMMFAVCHPCLSEEAQIALSLRTLCGFGIDEIASAFITSKDTINKRLHRAREKLRQENISMQMPELTEKDNRLKSVLGTIYLLFNEGYYSTSNALVLRRDLCLEAMRLCYLLTSNSFTDTSEVNALMSLICFHSSRFDARIDQDGELILYDDQDSSLWNDELIARGVHFLNLSARGSNLSHYHLEAGIAYWNTQKNDSTEKWEEVLQLYNRLLQVRYTPVAALNRTYALSKARGKKIGITAAENLNLTDNHFYFALLGELFTGIDKHKAILNYSIALGLAPTLAGKNSIRNKLERL